MSLMTRRECGLLLGLLVLTAGAAGALKRPAADDALSGSSGEMRSLGLRSVYFVENQGQWSDVSVHYGFRTRGLDIAFRESSFTMHLAREVSATIGASRGIGSAPPRIPLLDSRVGHESAPAEIRGDEDSAPAFEHLTLTVSFPGSNPVAPIGARPQAAKFNYFIGDDESRWASDVPSFGAIVYENIYDGVDLHLSVAASGSAPGGAADGVLKYEFHVAPGADYNQIRIAYEGIESLCLDVNGDLNIATSFGTLTDSAPHVWQESEGQRIGVPARFELLDDRTCRFAIDGPVDPTRELIIDPNVEWMVYVGGSGLDYGRSVALDETGAACIVGYTESRDFVGRNNSYVGGRSDAFLVKVDASGEVAWMTYLGGTAAEDAEDVATDGLGAIYVTGPTQSDDFGGRINSMNGPGDAFLAKVSTEGQLIWMTYVGGNYVEHGIGVSADARGAVVAGWTTSLDLPARTNSHHQGFADGFATRVDATGSIEWSTYLGGQRDDWGKGVAVTNEGRTLVTGWTSSSDFDGRRNEYFGGTEDAFLVSLDAGGAIEWMTYLGGSRSERGADVAVDSAGDILVTGDTTSDDFAGRNNEYLGAPDAFVLKSDAAGSLAWMTYFGGSASDYGHAIAIDAFDGMVIAGQTDSLDFGGRVNFFHGGVSDAFVATLDSRGQERSMMYLGGSKDDWGHGVAVGVDGGAFVSGATSSRNFPKGRNPSYGAYDAFVVRLSPGGIGLAVSASCPAGGPIQVGWTGATPDGQVALIFARNTGSFTIPPGNPCAGTELGLGPNQIRLAWQGPAGPNGSRTLNTTAGPSACGGYLQLLDMATCATSNTARVE